MASEAQRLAATAVLPEPPLGDTTTMTLPCFMGEGESCVPLGLTLTITCMPASRSATSCCNSAGA